jgi:orotidine-5'-phosphate decarboxylase
MPGRVEGLREGETGREPEPLPPKCDFVAKLEAQWAKGNFVCVGLDTDIEQITDDMRATFPSRTLFMTPRANTIYSFNKAIIDATHDLVCAYKPNSAFYEAETEVGTEALKWTVRYIKENYPEIPVIVDAKRGDIGNTNLGYIKAAFDAIKVDAITVHPYLGREALKPFLDRKDKGIIVLAKTSNPGAGEFQDLLVGENREPLYQVVARNVAEFWNENGNCALVVGATYPKELAEVRGIVGDMPILIPGIGAQGGEVEATVKAGKDSRTWGMIINSSRGIIYASKGPDFAGAARKATEQLRTQINMYR